LDLESQQFTSEKYVFGMILILLPIDSIPKPVVCPAGDSSHRKGHGLAK
jgi:hypothetical protein